MQLSNQDLSRALDLLGEIGAIDSVDALVGHVVGALPRLVASEITTLSLCDLEAGTRRVVSYPDNAIAEDERSCFDHYLFEHPLVRYHAAHPQGGAWRISDSLSQNRFRRMALYNEYYRRIGIDHVMAVPLIGGHRQVVSFVLNRKRRDFVDRDRHLLDRLRPGLATLYQRAAATAALRQGIGRLRESLLADVAAVIECATDGTVLRFSEAALRLIRRCLPGRTLKAGQRLPAPLDLWLQRQDPLLLGARPISLPGSAGKVTVECLPDADHATRLVLLRAQHGGLVDAAALPGLTAREKDVLGWVAAGKSNREIGAILKISSRTVQKHLEHVFVKLGVEHRTAAVGRAMELAGMGLRRFIG